MKKQRTESQDAGSGQSSSESAPQARPMGQNVFFQFQAASASEMVAKMLLQATPDDTKHKHKTQTQNTNTKHTQNTNTKHKHKTQS